MKFQRDYILTIGVSDTETVTIKYPLTLHFDVARSNLSSMNAGHLTIINLGESTRKKIFHDRWDTPTFRPVLLQAGYVGQNPLPVIFGGNILCAYSFKRGAEWVTDIEAQDGLFAVVNSQIDQSIPAGAGLGQIISTLMGSMTGVHVTPGAIGNMERDSSRGTVLTGNSWDLLQKLVNDQGGSAFIDQGKVHAIGRDEYIEGLDGIPLISSATGLKKAQRKYKGRIDVEMIFEPRLSIGQQVELQSAEPENNGDYQVAGVHHVGTISGTVDGGVTTDVQLWDGGGVLTGVSL